MKLKKHIKKFENLLSQGKVVPSILTRITVGVIFAQSGWGKLTHLDRVTEFFNSLGIPAARFQAPFAAGTELVCGLLLLLGLFSRLAALPLIIVMIVAIATAKSGDIEGVTSLFEFPEFLYIILLCWIATHGVDRFSLDSLRDRK